MKALRIRGRSPLASIAYYVVATALALAFLFPLLYIGFRSFLPANADATGIGWSSVLELTARNYRVIFSPDVGLYRYVLNSFIVGIATALLVAVTSTLAGYALARIRFRFDSVVFLILLGPLFVPYQGLLTPLSFQLSQLKLLDTLPGVILVLATFQLPFAIFVMRNTFEAVPIELEEAAQIDGASLLGAIRRIMLPLCWPGIVTVALFGFMAGWNDLLTSVVLLTNQNNYTLPIVLTTLTTRVSFGLSVVDTGLLTATACVATAPVVVLFLALQRYYTRGLISGSLKS